MILGSVVRPVMLADRFDEANLNKLVEKQRLSRAQKGDFNWRWSFAIASNIKTCRLLDE